MARGSMGRREHARLVLAFALASAPSAAQQTTRESLHSFGAQADASSETCALAADGRHVAFASSATNLAAGDTTPASDVFWHDRLSGATELVSVRHGGGGSGGDHSYAPAISGDGRCVAFASAAEDLVPGDSNGFRDVFVRDRGLGTTELASIATHLAQANTDCYAPDISADGRFVVFDAFATNLVANDTNGASDVFLRDRAAQTLVRVSVGLAGAQPNGSSHNARISSDGGFVVFQSAASNLVAGDTNGVSDVFLYEVATGVTTGVTVAAGTWLANGASVLPDVSGGGAFVAFRSAATNLVASDTNGRWDVFRWERATRAVLRVSVATGGGQAHGDSDSPSISVDGGVVAFESSASDLVAGDTNGARDAFRHFVATQVTERVDVDDGGAQAEAGSDSGRAAVSGDGRVVLFTSTASNLVLGDSNGVRDVFARGPRRSDQTLYCTAKANSNGCVPTICSTGSPAATGASDFTICAHRVLNLKSGIFFWGRAPIAAAFGGGTRCVAYPVVRTALQDSGGSATGSDCTGAYSFALDGDYVQACGMSAGQHVFGQYWYRDPFFPAPNDVGLTDAIEIVIGP